MALRDGWRRLFDYVYLGLSPSKHDAPSAMQSCIIDSSIPFLSGLEWARSSGDVLKILEKLVPVLVLSTHSMSAILDAKIAGMIVGSLAQHVPLLLSEKQDINFAKVLHKSHDDFSNPLYHM